MLHGAHFCTPPVSTRAMPSSNDLATSSTLAGFDQMSRLRGTSLSYNRERQQTTCVIGEQHRSFGEAEYFLVDRRIGGPAIQKEQIV
jgi:hypothetical protein